MPTADRSFHPEFHLPAPSSLSTLSTLLPFHPSSRATTKFIFVEPFSFSVLWDNTTRFVFTLAAAVLGLVAYFLFPSRSQLQEKLTSAYERRGRWLLFVFGFVTLGLAGVLGWELFRYKVQTGWVMVNFGLYAVLGCAILAGNIYTMRVVKHDAEHVDIVEAEVVEVQELSPPGQEDGGVEPLRPPPPPAVPGPDEPGAPR